MARTVRNAKLESRAARERLASGSKPHWKTLIPGKLHLGYRRKANGQAGTWLLRHYLGGERYRVAPLGAADDLQPSDGAIVLSYTEAQQKALSSGFRTSEERPLTVQDAIVDYLTYLRAERRTADDAELRARRHILPALGKDKVASLTTARLIRWRDELANQPAMVRSRKGDEPQFRSAPATENERRARRATVNRTWTIFRAALNRAWRHGHVPDRRLGRGLSLLATCMLPVPGT